ncbi:MAG: tRNA preQ1(34) S-adenosylmethionine ribosyltransferase-isomerase QueA [Gemmatimonas sp.]
MKLSEFDFELPRSAIAQRPAEPRDSARLLVIGDPTERGVFADRIVRDLPSLLAPGDLLVVNDTRVIPARLFGARGSAKVEATLHKREGTGRWAAFVKGAKRLKDGDRVDFGDGFAATVAGRGEGGTVILDFARSDADLLAALDVHGRMPLPPYIERGDDADSRDYDDYQTVFGIESGKRGAIAAPTAGLHFTDSLLAALDARGIARATVTLHVGAGTFLPVRVENVDEHVMLTEIGEVPSSAADAIARTRARGGRVVGVGTTVTRILETAAAETGSVRPFAGETDLFITPGYRFKAIDLLFTNFHLPKSTLFMLVSAFAGLERMRAAYAHAIAAGYRFYSYGDACLLHPQPGATARSV